MANSEPPISFFGQWTCNQQIGIVTETNQSVQKIHRVKNTKTNQKQKQNKNNNKHKNKNKHKKYNKISKTICQSKINYTKGDSKIKGEDIKL